MNILLSPNFSLQEMIESGTAIRLSINNTPSLDIIKNLKRLCAYLETARTAFQAHFKTSVGLVVTSGYRCPELNKAVGGVPDSAHVQGLAADVHAAGISQTALTDFLADTLTGYDQIINEGTWTHIGLTNGVPRMQRMVAHFDSTGKATYTETP